MKMKQETKHTRNAQTFIEYLLIFAAVLTASLMGTAFLTRVKGSNSEGFTKHFENCKEKILEIDEGTSDDTSDGTSE